MPNDKDDSFESQELYFEVMGQIVGFRQIPRTAIFIVTELVRSTVPDCPMFLVRLVYVHDPENEAVPRQLLWERLTAHCRKSWLVGMADDSKIKSSMAQQNCGVIGSFRSSNGVAFWLCHQQEPEIH